MIAAREFGALATGIEIGPIQCLVARWNVSRAGVSRRVRIRWGDFYRSHLRQADVIFLYATPEVLERLRPRLRQNMYPGARLVTVCSEMPDWPAERVDRERLLFVYRANGGVHVADETSALPGANETSAFPGCPSVRTRRPLDKSLLGLYPSPSNLALLFSTFISPSAPMLIHSASQLLTLAGGPQRGRDLGRLGIIEDGAVLIREETIVAVGKTADLRAAYPDEPTLDAHGSVVMPGLVDPHTHVIWAGDRAGEFEMKMAGKSYLDILAAGGGILSTVQATRAASLESLIVQTRSRLVRMFAHGTTTAEAKTGYGLNAASELRLLKALLTLDQEGPLELAITFMPAHAIPPEYSHHPQGYVEEIVNTLLPMVRDWWEIHAPGRPLPFVDVFCEKGVFTLEQSRQILTRARDLGFLLKIHADEFENLGGARLAVELGAASADHLVKTAPADFAALGASETVAVSLPCTPFGLAEWEYTPAHDLLEAGAILALASDCNPGTTWNESMQFVIALACRMMKLTPAQAIAAATINAAHALRRADRIGSIEVGKQADLLILSVSDYRHLGYRYGTNLVRYVIKKGRLYSVDVGYSQTA